MDDVKSEDSKPEGTKPGATPPESAEPFESQNRSNSWLWPLLGALGLIGGGALLWQIFQPQSEVTASEEAPAATAVTVEALQSTEIAISSEFVGFLEAKERATLRPEVPGQVVRVFVADGDRVSTGTPILQLSPERSRAVVGEAEAAVEEARAARSAAQAELLEAEAARGEAAAEKTLQDTEYERNRSLVTEGALAQQALDVVTRDLDTAVASLRAADQRVSAARANFDEATAALQRAESSTTVAAEDLADFQIVAPVAGAIGDLPVKVGDYVETGEALTTLTDNGILDLRMAIPVERSRQLQIGLPVELRAEAGDELLATGRVSFVAARVEEGAQSILAKATFPNPDGQLRDGQFVRATVVWDEVEGVLVPTTAISRIGGQSFVFVVGSAADARGEYIAEQRPVQLGTIVGNRYQVLQGLTASETIATSGILRLADGAPVMPEADAPDEATN